MEKPVVLVVGTRPDAIKLIPVYKALKRAGVHTLLVATNQHRELLDQVFDLLKVTPDASLNIMKENQDLGYVTSSVLEKITEIFRSFQPSMLLVQGDTSSSFAAALAAFYLDIPIAHVEAGLRTGDVRSPFPEEINRKYITHISDMHFAATPLNAIHLAHEGVAHDKIFCVGNTVVDTLFGIKQGIFDNTIVVDSIIKNFIQTCKNTDKKIITLTMHRRESFESDMVMILKTIAMYASEHSDVAIFFPVHPNPRVHQAIAEAQLEKYTNIFCAPPLTYPNLIYLLMSSDLVLTDSGGIQEESVSLGKPVFILRNQTERIEAVWEGIGTLIGANQIKLRAMLDEWYTTNALHTPRFVYGDGKASERIAHHITHYLASSPLLQRTTKIQSAHKPKGFVYFRRNFMTRISVIGLGYIGLPTAILASNVGYDVYGYDTNHEKIKRINSGDPSIFEPELTERLWKSLQAGTFKANTQLQLADFFIIAVPTPFKEDKTADVSAVFSAGEAIAKCLKPGNTVILESTVPVGTTEKLSHFIEEHSGLKLGIDFFVAYCPERVLPGKIFKELVENERIIGGVCSRSSELARQLYTKLTKGYLHIADDKTAEMVKLVENASRDVSIAFANQVDGMCKTVGIDAYRVIDLANKHPRVKILSPTCGVGGHCIAVDPWFLIEGFPESTTLLRAARLINDAKPHSIVERVCKTVREKFSSTTHKAKVFALGLTFKPDVDDLRESPALEIAQQLNVHKDLLELKVYDHNAQAEHLMSYKFDMTSNIWQGIEWSDIILVLVKHKEFTHIRQEAFDNKVIIDTCGLLYGMQAQQAQPFLEGATKTEVGFGAKEL